MILTDSLKPADVKREWHVVDATDLPLGRLASEIAMRLRGKHKADYTPHVDSGDNIVVINAEKVKLTGRKMITHTHFWHTGHPGGIKSVKSGDELEGKYPQRVIERAVERMLPKTKLGRGMIGKLHVYAGEAHPHDAHKPTKLDMIKILSKKNYNIA